MNEKPKRQKKSKTKTKVEISDLKTKKDPKGGIIAVLIDGGPTRMK